MKTKSILTAVYLLQIMLFTALAQVNYLEGDFDYAEVSGSTIHAADIENDVFFGFFPLGIPVSDYAPNYMPNMDTVHRVLFGQYSPDEGGMFNNIHYIRPSDISQYDSNYYYVAKEIKRIYEFDPFEGQAMTTGYIIVGNLICDVCTKAQYGFLIKTDASGIVTWTRRYDVSETNEYLSLSSVEPMDETLSLNGFVICGYRYNPATNKKIARVIVTDNAGVSLRSAEVRDPNTAAGSEFKKVIHYENDTVYALVGSANITNGLVPVGLGMPVTGPIVLLKTSDILVSTFFTSSGTLNNKRWGTSGTATIDQGISITKTASNALGVLGKFSKKTSPPTSNQVQYLDISIGNPSIPNTWSATAAGQYDITITLNESPMDIVFDSTTSSVWAVGNIDTSAFLFNIDPTTAALLINPVDRFNAITHPPGISGNAIVMAQASGNPVFYGETDTSAWSTLVERQTALSGNFNCTTIPEPVTETAPSLLTKVIRYNNPVPVDYIDTLYEYYDNLPGEYLCMDTTTGGGGGPPCSRLYSAENLYPETFLGDISVYPNPAFSVITISFSLLETSAVQIQIFNASGQLVKIVERGVTMNKGMHKKLADVSKLPSGTYLVEVSCNGARVNNQLVIQR